MSDLSGINKKFEGVIDLTRDLVKINSENPNHNEKEVENYILSFLKRMNFDIKIIPYQENRNNILAFLPSLEEGIRKKLDYIMFSGHMDTVPGYEITRSKDAPIEDGKIYGRGSCDMKGGIASFLTATSEIFNRFDRNKVSRGLCLSFTVDEEMGCEGVKALAYDENLNHNLNVEVCINCEPTSLVPVIGHKGIVWFILDFKGKAAHASVPHMGDNAIEKATQFIQALEKLKNTLKKKKIEDLPVITPPTLNVGIIKGGEKTNVVPDNCHLEIDRRLIPGETSHQALKEIKNIAEEIGLIDDIQFSPIKPGESYIIPDGVENNHYLELLKIGKNIIPQEMKDQYFMEGYTEADNYYRLMNIPTINLGPGSINQAHQIDEYVEIDQLIKATEFYYKIMENYLFE